MADSLHVAMAVALARPEVLDEEGAALDALDAFWLSAEAHGGRVARSAAHAVRIGFPTLAAATAWAEAAITELPALSLGAWRGALVVGAPEVRPDRVTGGIDLHGAAIRRAATLADGAVPGELRLDEAAARTLDPSRVRAGPTGPSLRIASAPAVPVHLPPDVGPFLGRGAAVAALLARIDAERVVGIVGPGGAGKTRLAVHVAWSWHLREQRPAAMAELVPATDLASVLTIVARALAVDIAGRGGTTEALARVAAALEGRGAALIVLDNAEHVLDAVEPLLALALPEIRWLLTSRVRTPGAAFALGGLPAADALTLLGARVAGQWTEADVVDARVLVDRLDRLPLAIALAAAQLHFVFRPASHGQTPNLTTMALAHRRGARSSAPEFEAFERVEWRTTRRTDERAQLLRPGQLLQRLGALSDPTRPARQSSLAAVIESTVALLEPASVDALVQLATFRTAVSVDDAEAVVVLDGPVWPALRALVDASLLRPTEGRFALYEQVRAHAEARLEADPRRAEILDRHARWATRGVEAWYDGRTGTLQPDRLLRLQHEAADLLAVLDRGGRFAALAACALDVFADVASPVDVHLAWLDRGVAAADEDGDPTLRARLRWLRGTAIRRAGRDAEGDLTAALGLAADDAPLRARVLGQLAVVRIYQGDEAEAERLARASVGVARAACAPVPEGRSLAALAEIHTRRHEPDAASERFAEAVQRLEEAADAVGLGHALLARSTNQALAGRHAAQQQDLDRAEAAFRRVSHARGVGHVADARWSAALQRGDEADAVRCLQDTIDRSRTRGERVRGAMAHVQLGLAALVFGRLERAEATLLDARAASLAAGLPQLVAIADLHRGIAAIERGDPALGRRRIDGVDPEIAPERQVWCSFVDALGGDRGAASDLLTSPLDPWTEALLRAALLRDGDADERGVVARLLRAPPPLNVPGQVAAARIARHLLRGARAPLGVSPDGRRLLLPDGSTVDLRRRGSLGRIVAQLAALRREAPGAAAPMGEVFAWGWPGERVAPKSATNRVHVAIATLRKLGLAGVLLTRDDGYLLDPTVPLVGDGGS